jgi:hypothetical protein
MRWQKSKDFCPFELGQLQVALHLLLVGQKIDLSVGLTRKGTGGRRYHQDPRLRVIPLVQEYTFPPTAVSS